MTVLITLLALPVFARQSQSFPDLNKTRRAAIVDSVTAALDTVYVFPDVATAMVNDVRQKLASGKYADITDVMDFTNQLTNDFQAISNDKHLTLRVRPLPSPAEAEDPELALKRARERNRFQNHNFHEAARLEGNIGYLKFDGFSGNPEANATAVAAMNFLANSDALIIDLTENGGGSPRMIQLLTSYLLNRSTHLNSFYRRVTDSLQQFWSLP